MIIETTKIVLERIEVIRRKHNKRGYVVEEQIEFYHPLDEEVSTATIGFKLSSKKKK